MSLNTQQEALATSLLLNSEVEEERIFLTQGEIDRIHECRRLLASAWLYGFSEEGSKIPQLSELRKFAKLYRPFLFI